MAPSVRGPPSNVAALLGMRAIPGRDPFKFSEKFFSLLRPHSQNGYLILFQVEREANFLGHGGNGGEGLQDLLHVTPHCTVVEVPQVKLRRNCVDAGLKNKGKEGGPEGVPLLHFQFLGNGSGPPI